MDIRQTILDELERRGWSHYKLAKAVEPQMSNVAVYDYLKGAKQMTAANLGHLLDALGITLQAPSASGGKGRGKAKG